MQKLTKGNVTKKALKRAAKMCLAVIAYDFLGGGLAPEDLDLTPEQFDTLNDCFHELAQSLAGEIDPQQTTKGNVWAAIEHEKQKRANNPKKV